MKYLAIKKPGKTNMIYFQKYFNSNERSKLVYKETLEIKKNNEQAL